MPPIPRSLHNVMKGTVTNAEATFDFAEEIEGVQHTPRQLAGGRRGSWARQFHHEADGMGAPTRPPRWSGAVFPPLQQSRSSSSRSSGQKSPVKCRRLFLAMQARAKPVGRFE